MSHTPDHNPDQPPAPRDRPPPVSESRSELSTGNVLNSGPLSPRRRWGQTAGDGREAPPVIVLGATGRLVRLSVVAVELGLSDRGAASLLKKLGVGHRTVGRYKYVHLFALERAMWRWFGLSDDLRLFEFAHHAYKEMERIGVLKHLRRLRYDRLGKLLRSRGTALANLRESSRLQQRLERRPGGLKSAVTHVHDEMAAMGRVPITTSAPAHDHPTLAAVRDAEISGLP